MYYVLMQAYNPSPAAAGVYIWHTGTLNTPLIDHISFKVVYLPNILYSSINTLKSNQPIMLGLIRTFNVDPRLV